MASRLEWHGDELKAAMRQAQIDTLLEVDDEMVDEARLHVAYASGDLHDSIKVQSETPFETNEGLSIEVGSDDPGISYAAKQELGPSDPDENYTHTPFMRPAQDAVTPTIPRRLRQNLKRRFPGLQKG